MIHDSSASINKNEYTSGPPTHNEGLPNVPQNSIDADLINLLEGRKYAVRIQKETGVDMRELLSYYAREIRRLKGLR